MDWELVLRFRTEKICLPRGLAVDDTYDRSESEEEVVFLSPQKQPGTPECPDQGAGLGMLNRNREAHERNGVAIVWRESYGNFKAIHHANPDSFEVLSAVGLIKGSSRRLAIIAFYIHQLYTFTSYTSPQGKLNEQRRGTRPIDKQQNGLGTSQIALH